MLTLDRVAAGQVYPQTTNPHVTTGDGIAMAYRAKAAMADMEFIQVRFAMDPSSSGQFVRISFLAISVHGGNAWGLVAYSSAALASLCQIHCLKDVCMM